LFVEQIPCCVRVPVTEMWRSNGSEGDSGSVLAAVEVASLSNYVSVGDNAASLLLEALAGDRFLTYNHQRNSIAIGSLNHLLSSQTNEDFPVLEVRLEDFLYQHIDMSVMSVRRNCELEEWKESRWWWWWQRW
jgi:hypothetical protein